MNLYDKLDILLKQGYIEPVTEPPLRRLYIFHDFQHYLIHETIEAIIRNSFEFNLKRSIHSSITALQRTIAVKSKFSPIGKEYIKQLLDKLIEKERKVMQDCIGEVESYNTPEYWYRLWPSLLLVNEFEYSSLIINTGLDLVYDIVFQISNNDIVSFYNTLKNVKPNYDDQQCNFKTRQFDWICTYFTNSIETVFTAVSCEKKIEYLKNEIAKLNNESKQSIDKKAVITAPVSALFCKIINESSILVKKDYQGAQEYCRKVCLKFNIPYTSNIHKHYYSAQLIDRDIKKVKDLIFPLIDHDISKKLSQYIDSNYKKK